MEFERLSVESGPGEMHEAAPRSTGSGRVAITQEGADELRKLALALDQSYNDVQLANARLLERTIPLDSLDVEFLKAIRSTVVESTDELKKSSESMAFLCLRLCELADKIENFLGRMGSSAMQAAAVSGAIAAAVQGDDSDGSSSSSGIPEGMFPAHLQSDGDAPNGEVPVLASHKHRH